MSASPISIEAARARILDGVGPLAPIDLPLLEAHGCVLAAELVAEYGIPPYSTAAVDGFALRAADVHAAAPAAPIGLRVVGQSLEGPAGGTTVGWGEAVRVVRGVPVPAGADAVAPMNECRPLDGRVEVLAPVDPGAFVRRAGEDVRAGEVLVPERRRLAAPELGLLAAAGLGSASVHPKVRVAVVATGSGLAEPGRGAFGRDRESASYAVVGAIRDAGAVPHRVGIVADVKGELREVLLSNLSRADCFVVTQEITLGEDELSEPLLSGLGSVEPLAVGVSPSITLEFGKVDGAPYLALPANPVLAIIAFELFVRPAILKMMGRGDLERPQVRAVLDADVSGAAGTQLVVPVWVAHREGAWRAAPTESFGTGALGTIVRANGLALVDPGDGLPKAGGSVRVQIFRALER